MCIHSFIHANEQTNTKTDKQTQADRRRVWTVECYIPTAAAVTVQNFE